MFDFKDFLGITFTLLGTVIGAGFISGREIITFFYGYDPVVSSILFATGFTVVLFILFFDRFYVASKWFSLFKPFVYVGNVVLSAGMLSALDGLYSEFFPQLENLPILSVSALIVSNVIVSDGIDGLKSANMFLTPFIIAVTFILLLFTERGEYTFDGKISVVNIDEYIGLNVFTSSLTFAELGRKANAKTAAAAAVTASLVLAAGIVVISLSIFFGNYINENLPLFFAVSSVAPVLKWIFSVVILFGIFTTLISCHYPLYGLVKTKKHNFIVQALLSATIFSVSRLGFYNIVETIYPIMGAIGFVYIVLTSILQAVFRSRRSKNTSRRREYKV